MAIEQAVLQQTTVTNPSVDTSVENQERNSGKKRKSATLVITGYPLPAVTLLIVFRRSQRIFSEAAKAKTTVTKRRK